MGLFSSDDVFKLADTDQLFAALLKRKHWKRMKPEVLRRILDHAEGDILKAKRFCMVSEAFGCVEKNFIPICGSGDVETTVNLISLTLERLAAGIAQHLDELPERSEQRERAIAFAEMAYDSSILCNPLMLGSYAGLALFYALIGESSLAKQALMNYDQAEQRLLEKPESQLSCYDKGLLESLPEIKQKLAEYRSMIE